MKILYDNTLSTKRLPKNHILLLNSYESPSKLNIKLKTHSLTSLDIPLETFVSFKDISSSSFRNNYQKTMAGSVDLISEIQQKSNDENLSDFSTSKPLINILSSNKSSPTVQQEWRQILKHRFRMSRSFITPTSLSNSVARLRCNGHLRNIHQSSLQTIDKITDRKHRFSLTHNRSIPKFTFRDLPSNSHSSSSSSINQTKPSSKSQMSPFTSLPEIRSFVAQNYSDNSKTINNQMRLPSLSALPSWQKTGSWSWKSNDAIHLNSIKNERIKANIIQKEVQHQTKDQFRLNLPVIIESPLQQRSSLQIIHPNDHHSPTKITNIHRPNRSFRNDNIQHNLPRLNQKKSFFMHSVSNYDVSPHQFSSQPTTHYPSTPLLAHSHHKNIDKFDYQHPCQLHRSPLATFDDDDDDDDSDSISSNSSFRSCINSINEFSDINTSELSSLSENSLQEMSSNCDFNAEIFNETIKHSRLSIRHLCILQ